MSFHPLENSGNLFDGYRKTFRVAGHHLLLLQHEGRVHLLDNICPHAGYPMEQGLILDGKLRCPMHGYLFDLDNGDCTFHPEGPCRGIEVYTLVEREGEFGVEFDDARVTEGA